MNTFNGTDLAGRKIMVREDREDRDVKQYNRENGIETPPVPRCVGHLLEAGSCPPARLEGAVGAHALLSGRQLLSWGQRECCGQLPIQRACCISKSRTETPGYAQEVCCLLWDTMVSQSDGACWVF